MKVGLLTAILIMPWLLMAQVQVSLDRSSIAMGETATLTVSIDGTDLNSYPEIPPVDGLGFAQTTASQSMNIINGVRSVKINIGYTVRASREGDFLIGPVKVKSGGKVHQSQPVKFKVTAARKPTAEEMNKAAFMQLNVPKPEVFAGEVFPLEVRLYFQTARGEIPQVKADGFSLSSPPQHTQGRVRLPNGTYQQHVFRYVAKALKTGDVPLGPAESDLEIQIPVQEPDPVFGRLIQSYRSQPVKVKSEVMNLKVWPLPEEGKPASFNGAIGQFSFRAVATKNDVAVGDPIILQAEITGTGAWDAVQLPKMDDWRDFKIYPPNSEFKAQDDLGIQGVKRFEIVVVPENADVKEIPAISFAYFDTEVKKYQTVVVPAVPLKVRASSGAPVQPTVASGNMIAKTEEQAVVKDILHIKPHFGTLANVSNPVVVKPVFWVMSLLPLLAWAWLVFWRRQTERAGRDPRALRAKAVAQGEAAGLAQLGELASAGKSKEFFDLLTKLLQERLGERLDMPASAITESVVDERLGKVDAGLRSELHELFQACNQARYAPVSDVAKLDALVEKGRRVFGELREVKA
ncbi:MAG TPA: BatD family protein [Verrucomicrobiae bacterium]